MIKNKSIYQVDAFTDEPFKGNPAGVMLIDENVDSGWMQNVALEMNLSETAFIIPLKDTFQIRYFTPTREVPLCGHATLASAHIIYELGLKGEHDSINFKAKGADLFIHRDSDWIIMNFPKYPLTRIIVRDDFKDTIGFKPIEMYSSIYDWIIAVAQTENDILIAEPDFEAMKKNGLGHLMITAKSDSKNIDFVLRCFAPTSGINEDPVTGSAHCVLTPLWHEKIGKSEFNSFQLSKRTGKLKVRLVNDRVEIYGKAITIFKADLKI
jgi:PhzF family phenazine biosynthesis protein